MGPLSPPPPPPRCPEPEGCCLELHETLAVLVALILLVQAALKLLALIGRYLCQLFHSFCAMIIARECEKSVPAPITVRRSHGRKHWNRWSDSDISRRKRCPRCDVRCTLEPLKLTMNLQNDVNNRPHKEPRQRTGYRHCPNCPAFPCGCCECDLRPHTASAPAPPAVTLCRDAACGTSEPTVFSGGSSNERRNELYPRAPAAEVQYQDQDEYSSRPRRPTKVYIYPVHPQTPPGSRSTSPERPYRRRGTSAEEAPEFEVREQQQRRRWSPRESSTPPAASPGLTRFRNLATSVAAQTEASGLKARTAWPDLTANPDWVYRPLK